MMYRRCCPLEPILHAAAMVGVNGITAAQNFQSDRIEC
jgi:hypothetical protein